MSICLYSGPLICESSHMSHSRNYGYQGQMKAGHRVLCRDYIMGLTGVLFNHEQKTQMTQGPTLLLRGHIGRV